MYKLPAKTLLNKQLSKERLYKELSFKPGERRVVDGDVSRIDIAAELTPETLPALMPGKKVKTLYVLRLDLKREACGGETLRLLARLPQTLVFALACGGRVRFALVFEGRVFTTEAFPEEAAALTLKGTTFDQLRLHLVADIAGLACGSEDSLRSQIERREQKQRLEAERASTEKKMWKEPQQHKRNELFERLRELDQEIAELEREPEELG